MVLYFGGPFPKGSAAPLARCLAVRIGFAACAHGGSISGHLRTVPHPGRSPAPGLSRCGCQAEPCLYPKISSMVEKDLYVLR